MRTVFLAGGGTGGHVFPLVAVADAMVRLCPDVRPIFVGTERGMETRLVPERGYTLELLRVLPIRGGGVSGAARGAVRAASLLPESRRLLEKYRPVGVFSVGGYAAGPVSLAGRLMGLPLGLLEPNSVIGLANQLLAPFVQRAYTAFACTEQRFSPAVVRPFGVPLRPGFAPRAYELGESRLRILVLGGSQGAQSLNEQVPLALARLRAQFPLLQVVHQCGEQHVDSVSRSYATLGGDHATVCPFIDDMPSALREADLVIGRSGASALSEITAVGRPSILIPYPFASGDHQRINAQALANAGGCTWVSNIEASADRLVAELLQLCGSRARLRRMAAAASRFGRPEAATAVAADFLQLTGVLAPLTKSTHGSLSGGPERSASEPSFAGGF